MEPEERLTRIETALDKQIEFVGASLMRMEINQEKAAQEAAQAQQAWDARQREAEARLDRHIEVVGKSLDQLAQQVNRTAAAQEVTEQRLQELVRHLDRHIEEGH